MDRWEAAIKDYQRLQTLDSFSSVLHTAELTLKGDLAQFELDWFVQTLLSEPVMLLDTISENSSNEVWSKVVKDTYKLLSEIVESQYEAIQLYMDKIILVCQKSLDARIRSDALHCLTSCMKRAQPGDLASQYIAELRHASTCKGPLALLVGTICEYHPEVVDDQTDIWRKYLNLLESNKNSDLLCKSLLKGVWGLFKHFGVDLPVNELSQFYDKLSREYLNKCDSAVLPILRDHASLFKEKLASDAALRRELWTFDDLSPLVPVYREATSVLTTDQIKKILRTEIAPKTTESYAKIKFTALRVCAELHQKHGVCVDDVINVDVYSLEFELRKEISYEVAEAVSWCIEFNMANSEKLLQTAIMFYQNLPVTKRKEIVVNGLLNAPSDVMNTTLNFLITETCQQEDTLLTYLPLWKDIFDSQDIHKKKLLFEKFMKNVVSVIENFLDEASSEKKIPDILSILLTLTSHVLTLQPVEDYTSDECAIISSKLVELSQECGLEASVVAVARSAVTHLENDAAIGKIYEMIKIDECKDEALLCESCLAVIHASKCGSDPEIVLKTSEIILSRKDAEPKTLSLTMKKLEELIIEANNNLNKASLSKCIQFINKLRSRKDMVGKDARVLQRDVTIFLGKYSNLECAQNAVKPGDNMLIVQPKDVLTLDLPNPAEGTTYKINLQRILNLAITQENEESLRMLLNIICASLCNNNSPLLQVALGRVVVTLCRATVGATQQNVARHAAVSFCGEDATVYILQQISEEKSPAVRCMLSNTIEGILLKDPGSEANEKVLKTVYGELCSMMKSNYSTLKLGGLDITESLLTALKVNRHQTKLMLPTLLLLISNTNEEDSHIVFENASKLFMENIGLFSADVLDSTINDLLKILLNPNHKSISHNEKAYKDIVKYTLQFVSQVIVSSKGIYSILFDLQSSGEAVKLVYLWSEIPMVFDVKEDIKAVLDFENCAILERVFSVTDVDNSLKLDAHLRFVKNYASVLFKYHSAPTLEFIGRLIEKLPPKYVKSHRKHLSECLTHCQQICGSTPRDLLKSFANWSESIPLEKITEHVEKEKFLTDHALSINSLKIMLEIFNLQDPTSVLTTVSIYAKTWTKTVLKHFAKSHFKYHKKHVPFLTDLLSVSLKFLTVTDVKKTLQEGHSLKGEKNDRLGVEFGRFFISVFVKYLVREPFLLAQDGMECCWVLVDDVVKWSVRKRWGDELMQNVLKLVDQLWPTIESKATFKAKHRLLLDLSCLNVKLEAHSRPMRWVTAVVGSNEAKRDDRIALVTVLPGGDAYSETYRQYASLLPTRLSDMDGSSRPVLRALLDALAGNADITLLNIVITLAEGDNTAGWWDEALASCMASLAARPIPLETLTSLYSRCRSASVSVCQRLLVPLLRCSPSPLCERFFASVLKDLLEGLSSGLKAPSRSPEYRACVTQKTIILDILLMVFEKMPASKIESPSSPLYEHIQTDKPWHLAREIMRLCFKLRDKLIVPAEASTDLSNLCREFQHAAYKCMCASVCARRPDAHIYNFVFNVCVWNKIVDQSVEYQLPLKTEWNRQKIRKAVSIVTGGGRGGAHSATRSLSRSRVFLRTLSENPLEYDLIHNEGDTNDIQDVELAINSLNGHACAGTLAALLRHCAELAHRQWRSVLREALGNATRNLRWLLAQAICNCKEDMKAHASELRPGLLAVIADTAQEGCNSLHIDILNTLINWGGVVTTIEIPHLNTTIDCLVHTALNNSTRKNIFKMLEDVLENMLRIFGSNVKGNLKIFEGTFDDSTKTKFCLKLILHFVKHNVCIDGVLPFLLTKLSENHKVYSGEMGMLAEVIGTLISNSKENEKVTAATKLKKVLEEVRKIKISNYVKILYYSGICDQQQLRIIVDLTQKLPEADKKKCLRIISTYICAHPDADEVAEIPANIRQMADEISVERQFEELFTETAPFLPHPTKRVKVDITSPILNTIGRNEKYIAEVLTRLGQGKGNKGREKMGEKLCKNNMAMRFVECFYIAIYLPLKYQSEKTNLSVCTSEFFQILFSHLKAQENFKNKRLRDEPWTMEHPIGLTKSRSKRMVGTLRTFSYTNSVQQNDYESEQGIDDQVSIEKILDTFIQFAKVTPEVSMELLTQLLQCLKDRGFDPRPELSHLLSTLLKTAPELVVIARECVDQLCLIKSFIGTADELMKSTIGSEGEQLFRLLREEIRLRCDTNLFVMGSWNKMEDVTMSEDVEFSIEGLVSAFQKLSNWDEVALQDRREIEASLPVLWTDMDQFKKLLDEYSVSDASDWFGQTVQLYRENRKDVMKWLRLIDKWPRRHYVVSAVIEAMQWRGADIDTDRLQLPCDIKDSDCLVEWAARLSLRTAYLSDMKRSDTNKLSRSHELIWCERANERGLHNSALSVIQRNFVHLEKDEVLHWMEQKMIALTMMGLNDTSQLEKALAISNSVHISQFYQHSNIETIVGVNMLAMQLNYKLESLSSSKVEDIITVVEERVNRLAEKDVPTIKNKKNLAKLYETAVLYYDGLWNQYELTKDDILVRISDCLGRLSEWNIDGASIAAILLNRLNECDVISDKAAAAVLAKMRMIIPKLPPCYIEQLKAKISIFPPQVIRTYGIAELQGESDLEMFKKCMQLLSDADYLLLQYCHELQTALQSNDDSKWDEIFQRMMDRIFLNKFAGVDYQALTKYQSTLDNIRAADSSMKRFVLTGIIHDLSKVPARATVRLSHVCPSLVEVAGRGLEKLLRLPAGVSVVKIEEELCVFTDSVRRPCVVRVRGADGRARRYLHKSEDLRADASVGTLPHAAAAAAAYTVIPLSEDCGLIEFLEDHKRIRELIASTCNIVDVSITRQAAKENELVLAPRAASEQNYAGICKKIPAYSLRSAIDNYSSSVQDFIAKKLRFLETLSDMTIANWLFGLGDRHLQNILYSMQDGGVQCIDWGAIFQYGDVELPPARLTRNMLAVCDPKVLESRLQKKLSSLRESHQLILPVLKLAFRWMENFSEKLVYIEGILKGTTLAHTITNDVIQKSEKPHKIKYIQLLDAVFADFEVKDSYSVEEQVSSLLLHSTDPWILSVTRSNWEPWL